MMEQIPELFDVADRLYNKMSLFVEKMYNFFESDKVDHTELFVSLDHYIQAILLKVAMADEKLYDVELSFIKKIVDYDDLFKSISFDDNKNLETAIAIADEELEKVPLFVKLSVYCDKKVDSLCQVIKPTYCQVIYDNLRRISNYLKYVDGFVLGVEDKVGKDVLKTIIEYYKKKYVKYAPERRKDYKGEVKNDKSN